MRWVALGAVVLLSGLLLASGGEESLRVQRASPQRRAVVPEWSETAPTAPEPEPAAERGTFQSSLRLSVFAIRPGTVDEVEWLGTTPTEGGVPVDGLWGVRAGDDVSLRDLVEALRGSGVRALTLSRSLQAEDFALLRELPELVWLDCSGCYGAGRAAVHLGRLTQLKYLDLRSTGIDDEGLAQLCALGSLETISLTQTPVGDAGMLVLASLPRLERVRVSRVALSEEGMRNLSRVPRLRFLELGGDYTDSAALAGLAGHPGLESIEFNHQNNFTPDTLAHLQLLPALQELEFDYCALKSDSYYGNDFTDECFAQLGGIAGLRSLSLRHVGVTDSGLAKLTGLGELERLNLCDTKITDAGMQHLRHFPRLRSLTLWDVGITDAGMPVLRTLSRLEEFMLLGRNEVSDAGLEHLPSGLELLSVHGDRIRKPDFSRFRDLQRLWLWDSCVRDEALRTIADLTGLRELNLDRTPVSSAGLAHLGRLGSLRALELKATRVDDDGIAHLRALDQLEYLDLGSTRVTGQALTSLSDLASLTRLDMSRTKMADADLEHLPPNLESLDVSNTSVTGAALPHLRRLKKLDQLLVYGTKFPQIEWIGKCRVCR